MASPPRSRPARASALLVALALLGAGCRSTPDEPEGSGRGEGSGPSLEPLAFEPPPTWTVVAEGKSGARKAVYRIKGGDKEEAELQVFFFGTGKPGDPEPIFKDWKGQFEGDVIEEKKQDAFAAPAGKVDWLELAGTYKQGLSPPIGPKKKSPVSMVKKSYRLVGAVVRTKDRGNWFFKLVGPEETVQAARTSLRAMLEAAK